MAGMLAEVKSKGYPASQEQQGQPITRALTMQLSKEGENEGDDSDCYSGEDEGEPTAQEQEFDEIAHYKTSIREKGAGTLANWWHNQARLKNLKKVARRNLSC